MLRSEVSLLFDHVYWMRDRILDAADEPGVPLMDRAPITIRDLRATLVHELDVEWSWRERLRGEDPTSFSPDDEDLVADDYPTVESIREHWQRDEAEMRAWLNSLTDDLLNGPCRAEKKVSHPLWFHLQHLYTHSIQQFSDAATVLTRYGRSPGELDFLQFVGQRRITG
jgi:uncharacterized damage-inducible protein DinB